MFYCGLMKVEKLKKCNVSNAGIAHGLITRLVRYNMSTFDPHQRLG